MARTAKQIEDRKRSALRRTSMETQAREARNVRESALLGAEKSERRAIGVRDVLKGGSLLRRRMANAREDAKKANLSEKDTQRKLKRTTVLHNVLERNPTGKRKPIGAKTAAAARAAAARAKAAKAKKAPPRKAKAKPKAKPRAKPRAIKKRAPKKRSSY